MYCPIFKGEIRRSLEAVYHYKLTLLRANLKSLGLTSLILRLNSVFPSFLFYYFLAFIKELSCAGFGLTSEEKAMNDLFHMPTSS